MHIHAHTCKHTRAVSVLLRQSAACPLPLCWIYCDSHYANEIPTVTLSFHIRFRVFFQDHCPKGSYGQNASHQPSLYSSSEQQGFHVAAWNKRPSSSLGERRGGLRPWGHGRPRVSVATGLDVDRPCLLLQRLPVHLPGQEKQNN